MGVERPEIFTVPIRARDVFMRNSEDALEGDFALRFNSITFSAFSCPIGNSTISQHP